MRARSLVLLAAVLASGCVGPGVEAPPAPAPLPSEGGDCLSSVKGIDLHAATIPQLQEALAQGLLTSVELVEAYVARIAAYDDGGPALNSVQLVNPRAREEAAALDAERAEGRARGPLHGIPVLLKDNVGTSDMPTTAGSIALAGNVPPLDAAVTERLREAGAVVLGKAQLSEFANWVSLTMPNGYSSLGGQVVNAYTGGDPSGSSSGSGVAGSMALAAVTLGTETSGSILSPSNANSLVGLKPTLGLVSRAGIIPLAPSFDVPGPMGRHVADVAATLEVLAGSDPRDPATAEADARAGGYVDALRTDALQGARLGYDPRYADDALFAQALEALEAQGATLVPLEPNDLDSVSILEIGLIPNEFKAALNAYLATEAGPGLPVATLTDVIRYNQQHPDKVKYGQDLLLASDAQPGLQALADAAAQPVVASSRRVADDAFAKGDLDALVGPDAPYTGLGAAAGYPTVVVPSGYEDGEPQGLSFFGPAWSEARLLGYAYAYEQATMLRRPPHEVRPALLEGVCGPGPDAAGAPSGNPRRMG